MQNPADVGTTVDPPRTLPVQELIPGEDPETDYASDAHHWIQIYSELLALKHELLQRVRERAADGGSANGAEVDTRWIELEIERLRLRLQYWQQRHWALFGLDYDRSTRKVEYRNRTVWLTHREGQLMDFLLSHPGRFYTSAALATLAWHDSRLAMEQVRTYLVRLRRKLIELGAPCRIENRRSHGYALLIE
jgi:DNA-binding response OmpR family regulator